jgi:hypothetical protein
LIVNSSNVGMFCKIIFSNKLDLFEATSDLFYQEIVKIKGCMYIVKDIDATKSSSYVIHLHLKLKFKYST